MRSSERWIAASVSLSTAEVASRLARASYAAPEGPEVSTVVNDATLEAALAAFLAALDAAGVETP
mgnify:CR=1 FL=1